MTSLINRTGRSLNAAAAAQAPRALRPGLAAVWASVAAALAGAAWSASADGARALLLLSLALAALAAGKLTLAPDDDRRRRAAPQGPSARRLELPPALRATCP